METTIASKPLEDEVLLSPTPYVIRTLPSKGRGLFATADIPRGHLLHTAPCILVTKDEYDNHMKHTVLEEYLFNCSNGDKLLALGFGSLFNHDKRPNIDYRIKRDELVIDYRVARDVKKDEELCIYYGCSDHLWFSEKGENHIEDESDNKSDNSSDSDVENETFLSRINL